MKNQLLIILITIIFMSCVFCHVGKLEIFAQTEGKKKSTTESISKIFKDVQGSVVQITRENKPTSTEPPGGKNVTSLGSGFVFDKEGRIITNHHVVQDSKKVDVTFINGNRYVASVLGSDPFNDIAVIKITQNLSGLHPLSLGNSSAVQVGDQVIAIGNPYGLAGSLSYGIVSQKGRLISTEGSQFSIPSVIQTDALINPGNSGGPLLNINEEVVGMNTAGVLSDSGGFSGIGLAVPSDTISKIVPVLINKGNYTHPWLGVSATTLTSELTENFDNLSRDFKGVYVDTITKDGPSDKAGLRGSTIDQYGDKHGNDIITAVDYHNVTYMEDLVSYLDENKHPGDKLNLTVFRNHSNMDISVLLGDRNNSTKPEEKDPYR